MVDGVLLHVGLVNIVRRHAERLRDRHEEMEKVHDFDLGVLLVELLVFGPPLPRDAVDQLGRLLLHGPGVIEDPRRLFLLGRRGQIHSNALIQRILHTKDLLKFVHGGRAWEAPRPLASPAPGKN